MTTRRSSGRKYRGARLVDVVGAALLLLVAAPLLLAGSVAVASSLGRPILFRHVRPGLDGMPFTLLKFRTMCEPADERDRYHTDGDRVTPAGRLLRKTSIDELPSLINVLRGDMSLVGPRPLLFDHLPHLDATTRRRMATRPGITGLAQVHGRQALTFSQRFALDVQYVDHCSLSMDLKILGRTFLHVLAFGRGVETGQSLQDVDDLGIFARRS